MIIETSVWCEVSSELPDNLGLPKEDCWLPFIFSMDDVVAVKLAGESAFIGDDKATVYLKNGDNYVIKATYFEISKQFLQHKKYYDK